MKMFLVQGYKDSRIDYDGEDHEWRTRGCTQIRLKSVNNYFSLDDGSKAINDFLKSQGYTDADIISVTVVPHEINKRDRGSNDYYVAVRDKQDG